MAKAQRLCSILLRLLALGATVSAAIVMGTSREKAQMFSVTFEAKYSDAPAFKYFLIANIIGSAYGFGVLFVPPESLLWRLAVVLDVVVTMLLTSGFSAALAIAYVGKKGSSQAGWLPICGQFHKYCDHVAGAMVAAFLGVILYLLLLLYSIHIVLKPLLLS